MKYVALLLGLAFGLTAQSNSLTLKSALELADKQNPSIAIAKLETLEAQAALARTRSTLRPQINGVIQGVYQTTNLQGVGLIFPGFPARVGPYRTFTMRPQATQTLFDLSLLSQVRAARATAEQRKWNEETAREGLRLAVVQLYLQWFEARSRTSAATARIAAAEALLNQVQNKESAGGASKLDVSRNQQQLFAERYLLTLAERDALTLETSLKELLGLPQQQSLELAPPLLTDAGLAAEPNRAEAKSLSAQRLAEEHQLAAAKRERLPKLEGFGDFGLYGQGPDQSLSTYQIGATLRFPIYTGGRLAADIRATQIRPDRTRQQQRQLDLQIDREIAESLRELASARKSLIELAAQVRAAQETLDLTRLRFESGLATSTDTTTAQSTLAEAQELEIRARYSEQLAIAKLARARGDVRQALP